MEILKTKGKIKEGQLILENPQPNLPSNIDFEVIIIIKEAVDTDSFIVARNDMITDFQNAGIETREQIASLIKDVKKELLKERYQ
jgi:hypothetical protein